MSRRRASGAGLLLLCVGVGLALLLQRLQRVETPPDPRAPSVDVAAALPEAPVAGPPAPPIPPVAELPEPIRRYLVATEYPPSSGRLTVNDEDLLRPNRRHERPRPIPDTLRDDPTQVVSFRLTADRFFYAGGETVHASLQGWRGPEDATLRVIEGVAVAEGRSGTEGPALPLAFVWDGDRWVADLSLARFADHHGPVLLRVRFEWEPGRSHEDTLRVFHTPAGRIPARLTGEFRDAREGGGLAVGVGVEVDRPGFYRFDANLRDGAGEPVAFATFKGDLESGRGFVPLEFHGKVLRDAGVAGPYTVTEIRGYRFLEGEYPDRERLPDSSVTHRTADYPIEGFSPEPWTSEHKRRMVTLMLEDLARGISLDAPPLPTPGAEIPPRPPDDDAEVALPEVDDPS